MSDQVEEQVWSFPYFCTCDHAVDAHSEYYCEADYCDCGHAYWDS